MTQNVLVIGTLKTRMSIKIITVYKLYLKQIITCRKDTFWNTDRDDGASSSNVQI